MNIASQYKPKLFHAGGLKLRAISQKLQFSFRRKAQVRTNILFIYIPTLNENTAATQSKHKIETT